ncbi:hypothetical protein AB0G32_21205 [Streptomyces sp. NPDC023723]|uniref:hypothetical protein n=1 Tax=Streptomyces sp. NPDC023723 TaxID=3154323 RepID=UPI00341040A2
MTAGWCSRTVRAAVFAAVCVLLAALGHVLMSGTAVPWPAVTGGAVLTGGAAWWLAGRERGPVPVGAFTVAAQGALHGFFSFGQGAGAGAGAAGGMSGPSGMGAMEMGHAHVMEQGPAVMEQGPAAAPGMLAAHLLAALLSGAWLAYGERAAFRLLRAVAGWLRAPLRPLPRVPALPGRPPVRARRADDGGAPRPLPLAYAITPRGPPEGFAVA